LRAYEVDESDLSAETAARKLGPPNELVWKTPCLRAEDRSVLLAVLPAGLELELRSELWPSAHTDVRNAGLDIGLAIWDEAVSLVECARCELGVQVNLTERASSRFCAQRFQHRRADPTTARVAEHGHAPDPPIVLHAASAEWTPRRVARQHVRADGVEPIFLQRRGNALFFDEDEPANGSQVVLRGSPRDKPNRERCGHRRVAIARAGRLKIARAPADLTLDRVL
jgi:hypothetical protein